MAYDGYAVTMHKGTNPAQGNYGAKYLNSGDAAFAQAFQMTKAEGMNRYILSFTTDEGKTRWLCDGWVYEPGSTADWVPRRIRTTDTESKALKFEIQFAQISGETPLFYLINTSVGESVGQNNNNDMYTTNPAKFSFAEAQKASVPVAIGADVRFATAIFPFIPMLPEDLKAYTCNATTTKEVTEYLVLNEVQQPAANTPYILYAANGCNSEPLTGWGTASASTYTKNYLTGIYEPTVAPANSYVLRNDATDGMAFCQVDSDLPTIERYQAYLKASATAPRPSLRHGNDNGHSDHG